VARRLSDVEALRNAAAAPLPELPRRTVVAPPPPARPIAARISVTPAGTIQWNDDFVSLAEFISRLRQTKATANPESRVHVRSIGSTYSAVTYVIDEARKAGIENLTVEAGAKADDKFSFWWF
jgi:biopolymer transport protein ExbD